MRLTCITPPAAEPLTLAEAKLQCRVRHGEADAKLNSAIRSARQSAELRTGRALITQTWKQVMPCALGTIELGRWPVAGVTSVKVDGQLLAPDAYQTEVGEDPHVRGLWLGRRVEVEFVAGYGEAEAVPQPIKDWMLAQVANLYENSSSVVIGTITTELGFIDRLLDGYVVPR